MTNSFIYKTDRPWPNARLSEGVIIGHTTTSTCKIWVRTGVLGNFVLLVYPASIDPDGELRRSLSVVPFPGIPKTMANKFKAYAIEIKDYSNDTTFVQTVDQLAAATEYRYLMYGKDSRGVERVVFGHDNPKAALAYSFRTLTKGNVPFTFGFYSCHMPYAQSIFGRLSIDNMEMWDSFAVTLARHRTNGDLSFVVGGGDQVYVDGVDKLNIWTYLKNSMRKENGVVLPGKEDMLSWYRDIYRGYWGFQQVKEVFSQYPNYMIWDDHELGDGWGSYFLEKGSKTDEMNKILGDWKSKGLTYQDCEELLRNMRASAEQVYREYQHSHNPEGAVTGSLDYFFKANGAAFYFQDGRGNRDINRRSPRILGLQQMQRFESWLKALDPTETPFVFVTSAVPLLHLKSSLVNASGAFDIAGLQDDLRDAWEHKLHDKERQRFLAALFSASKRGLKVCVLSGDVHTSAAFRLTDNKTGAIIYQLTSSAITYSVSLAVSWVLGAVTEDNGESADGYSFTRLARYTERNYSLIEVNPKTGKVIFKLYGLQSISHPEGTEIKPVTDSIANIELVF